MPPRIICSAAGEAIWPSSGHLASACVLLVVLALPACKPLAPPSAIEEPPPVTSSLLEAAAKQPTLTSTPAPTPAPTPTPPTVWFTLDRVSVTTADGVVGYPPGTMVRYVAEGLFYLDGHEIELSPLQVTPDLEVVSQVLAGREAQRQMIERQKIEAQRLRQQQGSGANQPAPLPDNSGQPAATAPGAGYSTPPATSRSGWYAGGRGPGNQAAMPVLRAEPAASPGISATEADSEEGPLALPLRSETPAPAQPGQTLQAASPASPPANTQHTAQSRQQGSQEGLKSAVRQYQSGNTRYTVRVTGEQVEE